MKNRLVLAVSCAVFCAALAGCHRSISKRIQFVITPDAAAKTVSVTCEKSATGKCRFTFSGETSASGDIPVGSTVLFRDIAAGTRYCAESFSTALANCKPALLPTQKSTITRTVTMSEDAGE